MFVKYVKHHIIVWIQIKKPEMNAQMELYAMAIGLWYLSQGTGDQVYILINFGNVRIVTLE